MSLRLVERVRPETGDDAERGLLSFLELGVSGWADTAREKPEIKADFPPLSASCLVAILAALVWMAVITVAWALCRQGV